MEAGVEVRVDDFRSAALAARGSIVADADLFIASIAISRAATIVTGNRRHFERIPCAMVEDWLRA